MLTKFQQHIHKKHLFNPQKSIIVGVSGGLDSVVLLDLLIQSNYKCIVAHANFHLRGRASDRDEKFVQTLAEKKQIKYEKIDFDTQQYAKTKKISIEMAARELRYQWFEKISQKHQTDQISVAHHADDNIETLLLNLIRGTGLKGLTGIPEKNKNIIRPLLPYFRTEIEQYAAQQNITHVTDHTNLENTYQRNKIRNLLIPLLTTINPSIKQTLLDNIQRFSENANLYFSTIETISDQITEQKGQQTYIDIQKLLQQNNPQTILYEILKKKQFNAKTTQNIFLHINQQTGKQYHSHTHRLLNNRGKLIIQPHDDNDPTQQSYYISTPKEQTITHPIPLQIKQIKRTKHFQHSTQADTINIDLDIVQFPLIIRRWIPGDSFQPLGMKGRKKVSDFFIDKKINQIEKENSWILCNQHQEIIWIIGKRLDHKYRITPQTKNILSIKVK